MSKNQKTLQQELQQFIDDHLPAVQRLEFAIVEASEKRVILSAPLSANINDKLTAFGGSQQMLALTCAWSLVYLNMIEASLKEQQYVIAEVNTRYRKPVKSDIFYAVAERSEGQLNDFIETAKTGMPARATSVARIYENAAIEFFLQTGEIDTKASATKVEALFATTR